MVKRPAELRALGGRLRTHLVVGIVDAPQVGKPALARGFASGWNGPTAFYDLEDLRENAILAGPMLAFVALA